MGEQCRYCVFTGGGAELLLMRRQTIKKKKKTRYLACNTWVFTRVVAHILTPFLALLFCYSFKFHFHVNSGRTQREAMEAASDLERPQPRVSRTPSRRYQRRASITSESPHHISSPTDGSVAREVQGIVGNESIVAFSSDSHSRYDVWFLWWYNVCCLVVHAYAY